AVHPGGSTTPQLRAAACDAVWYLLNRGDPSAASRLGHQLRESWQRASGPDDIHILTVSSHLARSYRTLGDYAAARDLDEQVLLAARRLLGDDAMPVIAAMGNLALDLSRLGEYEKAR